MKALLETHKNDIKADFKLEIGKVETKISAVETSQRQVSERIDSLETSRKEETKTNKDLKDDVESLREEIRILKNSVIRQGALLQEDRDKREVEDLRAMRKEMIIRGLIENDKESCKDVVNQFIMDKLKIQKGLVNVMEAHRMGQGKNRPMLIRLHSPAEKGQIYKHVKNLKGVTNILSQSYQVSDHLPPRINDQQTRFKILKRINRKKTVDQLEMNLEKGSLLIKGSKYKKLVSAPSDKDILKASAAEKLKWSKIKLVPGNIIRKEKCEFHGFSLVTNKINTIRDAYCKLRIQHGSARHIVCSWRLPGTNWPQLQDYENDDEHNAGKVLLQVLTEAEIFNRAVFVVRYYGGAHLGPSRFQAFKEAAQSAITHDPYNHISKANQTPWPKDSNTQCSNGQGASTVSSRGGRHPSGPSRGNIQALRKPQDMQDLSDGDSLIGQQDWNSYYQENFSAAVGSLSDQLAVGLNDMTRSLLDSAINGSTIANAEL